MELLGWEVFHQLKTNQIWNYVVAETGGNLYVDMDSSGRGKTWNQTLEGSGINICRSLGRAAIGDSIEAIIWCLVLPWEMCNGFANC